MNLTRSALLSLAALAAVPASAIDETDAIDETEAAIIDGTPATSTSLDAIGTMAFDRGSNGNNTFCTGVLVAPKLVLSTKTCLSDLPPDKIFFIVGKESNNDPRRAFRVVRKVGAPDFDAGLFQLQTEVTGVTPMPMAQLSTIQVGKRLDVTGFGTDEDGRFAVRKTGKMTLLGTRGKKFELIFGSFQAFLDEGAPTLFPKFDTSNASHRNQLRGFFDTNVLLTGEAWLGGRDGDVSACDGDNGGPATTKINGKVTMVAYVSRKLGQCEFGGLFSAVTPKLIDFVKREGR